MMRKVYNALGGLWVSFVLIIRCRGKLGAGSYLAWRKETAFGKKGQFPALTSKQRRAEMLRWSIWAWRSRK
jgi:hypothetical protein